MQRQAGDPTSARVGVHPRTSRTLCVWFATFGALLGLCSCSPKESPHDALLNARRLTLQGRYEDALQKHVWIHEHGLEQDPNFYGVRLSFALAQWVDLGKKHPPALDALRRIRDRDADRLLSGARYARLMHEVASINNHLNEPDATVQVYSKVAVVDPGFAAKVYDVVESTLVTAGAYELARTHLGDPKARFAAAKEKHDETIGFAERHPEYADASREIAESTFTDGVLRLIEILERSGDDKEARECREAALGVVDNPRLRGSMTNPVIGQGGEPNGGPGRTLALPVSTTPVE